MRDVIEMFVNGCRGDDIACRETITRWDQSTTRGDGVGSGGLCHPSRRQKENGRNTAATCQLGSLQSELLVCIS